MQALDGIRILDLTRLLPGPAATHWLRQMGAEIAKIEDPRAGDGMRSMQPHTLFDLINQGKKSVALDLKSAAGRDAFLRLAAIADVVIEGFRPGVMERLGLSYGELAKRNPRLIYAALTGYGQSGAYSHLAGHDINYLAMAGVLDLMGPEGGPPSIPGVQIADLASGAMQVVVEVLGALLERARTGQGRFLDISMTHRSTLLLPFALAQWSATGQAPRRGGELLSGRYACYNIYRSRDGRYLAVGALEPKFWMALCEALECRELAADQFAGDPRRQEVIASVAGRFAERDAAEWFEKLRDTDACVTPVRTMEEAARDFQLEARAAAPGPRLGEHTEEVLRAAGYGVADIALVLK